MRMSMILLTNVLKLLNVYLWEVILYELFDMSATLHLNNNKKHYFLLLF